MLNISKILPTDKNIRTNQNQLIHAILSFLKSSMYFHNYNEYD